MLLKLTTICFNMFQLASCKPPPRCFCETQMFLSGKMDSGEIVAVLDGSTMKADAMTKALDELDSVRDKTVDMVMATKLPALEKKK